jgi:hypothetical protein
MLSFRRPSPSLVISCLALAVALSGTAVAASVALAPNSVGTPQLKNNAVTSVKVANGSLLRADFKAGQVPAGPAGPAGAAGPAGPAGAAGPAGPAGPSDAYARFLNGPIAVPAASTTLANLSIPQAGKYVIWAKTYFTSTGSGVATCRLEAGTDVDVSQTYAAPALPFDLTTLVVHEFAAAGSVDFKCAATGTQAANYIKIAAIKVGNLTNTG